VRDRGPESVLRVFADNWRTALEQSGFRSGCAVLAAATATDPRHHVTARAVFEDWHQTLAGVLVDAGVPATRAPGLARTMVATVEGAVALARAAGTADPLDEVVVELADLVKSASQVGPDQK